MSKSQQLRLGRVRAVFRLVGAVYSHFRAHSRAALLARWVRQ